MPDASALLYANLHEVFSERDPEARWAAIERTYAVDVKFIDPEGEVVGRQALNDRACYALCWSPGRRCDHAVQCRRPAAPDPPIALLVAGKQVVLTERGGFEPPMDRIAHTGFRDRRIQPLCHLSGVRRTTS